MHTVLSTGTVWTKIMSPLQKMRLYDVEMNCVRGLHNMGSAVLDCCFQSGLTALCGGLSRELKSYDFEREADFLIGKHSDAIRCVKHDPSTGLIFTGSWDQTVGVWDARTKNGVNTLPINAKVFAMAVTPSNGPYGKLVVGDSEKNLHIYDIRNLEKPEETRSSAVKYQIRCVESFADGRGFAVGTTEGRVAYEYFNEATNMTRGPNVPHPAEKKSYAFRCHREKLRDDDELRKTDPSLIAGTSEKIFPVNAIAFHNGYNTFATGGSDGSVSVWDGSQKKRLWRLNKPFPTAITSLSFSQDGAKMALAVSYDFTSGPTPSQPRYVNMHS